MTATELPFKAAALDFPESHFRAFQVCNTDKWIGKRGFYEMKNLILRVYGHENDYDLQYLELKCHSCNGSGWYYSDSRCRNCGGTGIFRNKRVVLERFLLNGHVFHKPLGELEQRSGTAYLKIFTGYSEVFEWEHPYPQFKYEPFIGIIRNRIHGLITHEKPSLSALWSYLYLLWHYDRNKLYETIQGDVRSRVRSDAHKLRTLLDEHKPLTAYAIFLNVKESDLIGIEDFKAP